MVVKSPSYRQLDQDEGAIEKDAALEPVQPRAAISHKTFIITHLTIFILYLVGLYFVWNRSPTMKACSTRLSTASPALPKITYMPPRHLDTAIFQKNPYRGPPSPDIDAAWARIGVQTPAIRLHESDLLLLNKSTPTDPMKPLHRIPDEHGGGYIGMLEVFHLLHCLDELRKSAWPEYYVEEWKTRGGLENVREHNDHCIDMLREILMCNSDVTPVTFYDDLYNPRRKMPMPDFETLHTCRNFEEVLQWNNDNERTIQWDEIGLEI